MDANDKNKTASQSGQAASPASKPPQKIIWWPLGLILILALGIRVALIPQPGFQYDLAWNSERGKMILENGLLNIYRVDKENDYPPVYLSMLGVVAEIHAARGLPMQLQRVTDPSLISLLKVFPICGDVALIIAAYVWLRHKRRLRIVIPMLLALNPALVIVSAVWGQSDSLMTTFVVLSLVALEREKPRTAWAFFAVAMLTKFQSVVVLPILVILTLRRFGWRTTIASGLIAVLITVVALFPFALSSGIQETLRPYTGAVGEYPVATVNAFNLWYMATPHRFYSPLPWPRDKFSDTQTLIGPLTYKTAGLGLFAVYGLMLVVIMWRTADRKRELIWTAAFYFGFFMLPTEIHERYFYPAAIIMIFALAQDRRLWPLAILSSATLSYNLLVVLDGRGLIVAHATLASAINLGLFILMIILIVIPSRRSQIRSSGTPVGVSQ